MRKILYYFLILLLFSCDQGTAEPLDLGYDYMPLQTGRFWIYAVDQTVYFGEGDSETSTFFYRDIIVDSYIGSEGNLVFIVNRESSPDQQAWENTGSYTLQSSKQALIRNTENTLTIPLVFPPKSATTWDGNAYNTSLDDEYRLENANGYEVEGRIFANAIKVLQEMEDDKITIRDNRFEVYAKGVGMIEQYVEILTYCSRNDCLGEQIIEEGRFIHLKLINNGQY